MYQIVAGRAPSPVATHIPVIRPDGYDPIPEHTDEVKIPADLYLIRRDKIKCPITCVCKNLGKHTNKTRAQAQEIISHKVKDGHCFLLCMLDSARTAPTYLRQCEVPLDVRQKYYDYYRSAGKPRRLEEYWDKNKERAMRDALFAELSEKELSIQVEIANSIDTNDWDRKTGNGRAAARLNADSHNESDEEEMVAQEEPSVLAPAPTLTANSPKLWVIERVLGALITREGKTRRRWFLIKWDGWEHHENSWEPERKKVAGMKSSKRCEGISATLKAVKEFFRAFGRPTVKRPKILSPDGELYEKLMAAKQGDDPSVDDSTSLPESEPQPKKKTRSSKRSDISRHS
ncbi:hypothetical protein BV898_08658 [Hypsibius exemplaris]|uniref:Chromo domain-containing protein n=1 Tax=Hypsibius exemplaris TaxID=2072580 RepID=A0A1W0WPW9_HYPEX|nr:hypothetical protein BV898_08658 [Hypsibius exemplaris]